MTIIQYRILTIGLLVCSNTFMSFAWYSHLKNLSTKPIFVAVLISWLIALLEYSFMVPSQRIGFNEAGLSLAQLKIIQEVVTLSVFVPFAVFYMKQPISLNFLYAGLCLLGAVYFMLIKG